MPVARPLIRHLSSLRKLTVLSGDEDSVFPGNIDGKPLSKEVIIERFYRALEKARIERNRRNLVPHSFRHYFVSRASRDLPSEIVNLLSGHLTDVAAATAASEKAVVLAERQMPVVEKPSAGKTVKTVLTPVVDSGAAAAAESINGASAKIGRFMQTKGLGDNYQALVCIGLDGITFAASDPSYLNVNVSAREYFKTALAGAVNAGEAGLNTVTKKPFAPFAAPIRRTGPQGVNNERKRSE